MESDAQTLIDECDTQKFNPKQFRQELNISWLKNDIKKQFEDLNKKEVNQNG